MNRRLYRSRTDTILGGVAAGLAHYLNADPALVRIAWAILVPLTGGAALLAYIVAWIVVPEEPATIAPFAGVAPDAIPGEPVDPGTAGAGGTPDQPPTGWVPPPPVRRGESNAGLVVGAGLVLLGLWFLLREYFPGFDWGLVWPLLIVGIGVLILLNATRRKA